MRPEDYPCHPAPPEQEHVEISLSQLLYQTVESLFAQQPIANIYQGKELDEAEFEAFVRERKKKLFLELLGTTRLEMVRFLTDLKEMEGKPVSWDLLEVNDDAEGPTM